MSLPRKSGSCQTIHTYKPCWFSWVVVFEAHFGCHDVLFLGKNPIKWRQPLTGTLSINSNKPTNSFGLWIISDFLIFALGIPLHTPVLLSKSGVQGGIHVTDMFS